MTDRIDAIQTLLADAEQAHGGYEASELNGIYDQDWPRWYAAYAVDHGLGELLGHEVSTERLAAFLAASFDEFKQADTGPEEPWAAYTARRIAAEL